MFKSFTAHTIKYIFYDHFQSFEINETIVTVNASCFNLKEKGVLKNKSKIKTQTNLCVAFWDGGMTAALLCS